MYQVSHALSLNLYVLTDRCLSLSGGWSQKQEWVRASLNEEADSGELCTAALASVSGI